MGMIIEDLMMIGILVEKMENRYALKIFYDERLKKYDKIQ